MRWQIKRIRELEASLRSNGNPDMEEEYVALHTQINRPFPKDFIIEDPFDKGPEIIQHG